MNKKYEVKSLEGETIFDKLLFSKGFQTRDEADEFLNPKYDNLHDPFLMHDMEKACVRIFEAVEANEKIVIFSDYDCDGIPGGVVLHDFFKKINYKNFSNYVPDRHNEGYGLSLEAVENFAKDKVGLIITVDLGTTNVAEIAQAKIFGIDTIVTDHHIPHGELPNAFAIVNPKLGGYPDPMLCGAGVAFKVVQGLIKKYGEYWKINEGSEKWLLDMVGIATLSDMVPLQGENRIFAYYGLQVLRKSPRPGLVKLFKLMKIDQSLLTEDDITFMLAPRLNAAGRMDSPMKAFQVLATDDAVLASAQATELSKINDQRKFEVARIMKEVHSAMEKREEKPIVVIGSPSWRIGVLGLVASKIVETYKKPAFVWGREGSNGDSVIKGSCRSDGSIHVVSIMEIVKNNFEGSFADFGGHELAGGFSVAESEVHFLEERLITASLENYKIQDQNKIIVDAVLTPAEINNKFLEQVLQLAPFGTGNDKPVFALDNITLAGVSAFGKEFNHLKLLIENGDKKPLEAIAFFKTHTDYKNPNLKPGGKVTIIGNLEKNFFGGASVRIRIVDIL